MNKKRKLSRLAIIAITFIIISAGSIAVWELGKRALSGNSALPGESAVQPQNIWQTFTSKAHNFSIDFPCPITEDSAPGKLEYTAEIMPDKQPPDHAVSCKSKYNFLVYSKPWKYPADAASRQKELREIAVQTVGGPEKPEGVIIDGHTALRMEIHSTAPARVVYSIFAGGRYFYLQADIDNSNVGMAERFARSFAIN